MDHAGWNIIGEGDVALALREAAEYVEIDSIATVVTSAATMPAGAIATDRAMLLQNAEVIVPHLLGFQAIEEVVRSTHSGDVGQIYGCYGSYRVERGTDPEGVALGALLPLVALALEIIGGEVNSAWARRASLLSEGDAWFVTLSVGAMVVTLEAMATADPEPDGTEELLIEVTGSERVLRAEPTRQAVTVESIGAPTRAVGWWEAIGERLLRYIATLDQHPPHNSGERLRSVWNAIEESAATGQPVTPA